jgi:hypothetical protein
MQKIAFALFVFCVVTAQNVWARPILIELFTSQGCSSCPAGEKAVAELNERDDFFALSFHVDYWDRLGWKDIYAKREFTNRQSSYMRVFGDTSVYTPQAVIDGVDETIASWGWRIKMLASSLRKKQVDIPIHFMENKNKGYIKIPAFELKKAADIWYVTYIPKADVDVKKGESRGRKLHSVNVVRTLKKLTSWNGQAVEIALPEKSKTDQKIAIFIQEQGLGQILGLYTE